MTTSYEKMLVAVIETLHEVLGQQPQLGPVIGPTTALLSRIAADVDAHVPDRLSRIDRLSGLLQRARGAMPAADSEDIVAALASVPSVFDAVAVQNIDEIVSRLKRALIVAHAWLEVHAGAGQNALLDDVWAFCEADARRASRMETNLW